MTVRTRPATEADYAVAGSICYEAYRADGQLDGGGGYGRVLADVAARAPVTEVIVADEACLSGARTAGSTPAASPSCWPAGRGPRSRAMAKASSACSRSRRAHKVEASARRSSPWY